jgi:hypothetical protein
MYPSVAHSPPRDLGGTLYVVLRSPHDTDAPVAAVGSTRVISRLVTRSRSITLLRIAGGVLACAVWSLGAASCLDARVYPCDANEACVRGELVGSCEPPGYCAYDDETCGSGLRFGPTADAFANDCVPADGVSGGESDSTTSSTTSTTQTSATTTEPDTCDTGCVTPPTPCHEAPGDCDTSTNLCVYTPKPLGDPCSPDDPCLDEGTCNAAGDCDGPPIACDQPGECEGGPGMCNSDTGNCEYPALDAGSPCDDGNACTIDDDCDSEGTCVPGEECPSTNPCESSACIDGGCMATPLADGSSCGARAADRCCSGNCVDIASDTAHCGGCGMACVAGTSCESADVTTACVPAPADTTGRCTCNAANADCPNGQICRNVDPGFNRCAPEGPEDCTSLFTDVANCPNFCSY